MGPPILEPAAARAEVGARHHVD